MEEQNPSHYHVIAFKNRESWRIIQEYQHLMPEMPYTELHPDRGVKRYDNDGNEWEEPEPEDPGKQMQLYVQAECKWDLETVLHDAGWAFVSVPEPNPGGKPIVRPRSLRRLLERQESTTAQKK